MCRRIKMMYTLMCFILLSGLIVQCVYSESDVGCLFSPRLCEDEEECFDDNAFGRCQTPFSSDFDHYRHLLGSETTKLLERELTRLFAGGYRWRHQYTQCVVQNILYANRHKISYDPGLCSRVMQFTIPNVPPEVLSDLESPDPEELAYIKFKPNRDDPESAMFADEIFNPPVRSSEDEDMEIKGIKKRSFEPYDEDGYLSDDWMKNAFNKGSYKNKNDEDSQLVDKEALYRKLLETADDTEKLLEQLQNKADHSDRYPDENTPVVRTDLSSDMNHRAAFSEGGTEWLPVDDDTDYFMENDILDPHEKKGIDEDTDVTENNDISLLGRGKYDDSSYSSEDNDIELTGDTPSYESLPLDDDDTNFRWNYNHISKDLDDDLTRFSRGNSNAGRRNHVNSGNDDKNLKDIIEDDYLEDKFYAILPADKGMSTFTRDMRYDTKKPGPTYMIHEDEDGDTTNDDIEMAGDGPRAFISRLSKTSQEDQLLALLNPPVVAQKSSAVVVPSRQVIGGAFVTQN